MSYIVCGVTDTDAGNMEQLKALADELKILIHIGSHLNILNVLGAVTQDLDNGDIFTSLNVVV